jgi:glutamyl-tRNA reductase
VTVLVVGLSYRTAPLELLERAALTPEHCRALESALVRRDHVAEAVVLSTCNRLEVYAEVGKFHGGVADVGAELAAATGVSLPALTDHLYVHYDAAAVTHLFTVACGLDSMAVGEQQILGQVRLALRAAREGGSVGGGGVAPAGGLDRLLQHALRAGKRAHAETGLDRAGRSLVEAGLEQATAVVGPLAGADVLVVGAGSMSGLAVATLARTGVRHVTVAGRTAARAQRLADAIGGSAVSMHDLGDALAAADVVISCTGAVGHVISRPAVGTALADRGGRPQVYVDLALPRDVEPEVAALDGATVLDLADLGRVLAGDAVTADLAEVRELVAAEVAAHLAATRAEAVAPTVVALRAHARRLVDAELTRLEARLGGDVDPRVVAELERCVHRVVEKLLHTPTVRVKELAGEPGGSAYADALRALFDLDLDRVAAVSGAGPALTGGAA